MSENRRKMRRLPETDLARIAGMPQKLWRSAIEGFEHKKVFINYNPVRKHMPDIVNEQPPMLAMQPTTDWAHVERLIIRASRTEEIRKANLAVAKSLLHFTTTNGITARRHPLERMQL